MLEDRKVPLSVAWLSENGLLVAATELLGYTLQKDSAGEVGVPALYEAGPCKIVQQVCLLWEDNLLFTVAQLLKLGFTLGEVEYLRGYGGAYTRKKNWWLAARSGGRRNAARTPQVSKNQI